MSYLERAKRIDNCIRRLCESKTNNNVEISDQEISNLLNDICETVVTLETIYTKIHEIIGRDNTPVN